MVRHYNECYYCRIVDNRGLRYSEELFAQAMCKDCIDKIPSYLPIQQHHHYLMEKVYGRTI